MGDEQVDQSGLVQALVLDGQGGARSIGRDEIDTLQLQEHETLWLHWDRSHLQAQQWLREQSGLSGFVCDLLLEESTRPRLVPLENQQMLLFLRGVNLNPGAEPEDMISVRIFVEPRRVISLRLRPMRARIELTNQLSAGRGARSATELVLNMADLLTDKIDPLVRELSELVDFEEEQLDSDEHYAPEHDRMLQARRRSASLRRFLAPQRDIFFQLTEARLAWFAGDAGRQWNELGNSLTRHLEELELVRERVELVLESEHRRMSERMNRVMYLFAIITGFFLPLSFITGLLGINVGGIPGSDNSNAFVLVCLAMVALGFFQAWLYRRLRWL